MKRNHIRKSIVCLALVGMVATANATKPNSATPAPEGTDQSGRLEHQHPALQLLLAPALVNAKFQLKAYNLVSGVGDKVTKHLQQRVPPHHQPHQQHRGD